MKYFKSVFVISIVLVLSLLSFSCKTLNNKENVGADKKKPKYIFLFIGDGMGINHASLAKYFYKEKGDDISFTNFPYFGVCTTTSKNSVITDSGAAGSAIACGEKANFGSISYYPWFSKDSLPLSFAKIAHENGKKVGIITTVSLNHATPAAFYAQSTSRNLYYEIGSQLPESGFEFFGGGGLKHAKGKENTQPDLYEKAKSNNYIVSSNIKDFEKLDKKNAKYMFVNPKFGLDSDMPYFIDKKSDDGYSLAQFVKTGIKVLENPNGFFMMVEGGKIDWAAHSNDGATIVKEIYDMDLAIREAYKFYEKYPEETLIFVTADHETGGLSLGNAQMAYESNFMLLDNQKISITNFSEKIKDYKENNTKYSVDDIWKLADEYFFTETPIYTASDSTRVLEAFNYYFYEKSPTTSLEPIIIYGAENPVASIFGNIMCTKAGVGFTTWAHTAAAVPVFAVGVGADRFGGAIDNTEIKKILLELVEW
jgi:alkaline phosphatase